jgi:hypothetical protein
MWKTYRRAVLAMMVPDALCGVLLRPLQIPPCAGGSRADVELEKAESI